MRCLNWILICAVLSLAGGCPPADDDDASDDDVTDDDTGDDDSGDDDSGDDDSGDDDSGDDDSGDDDTAPVDSDGDGFDSTVDCDDSNPSVHPGAVEICDGLDNDCDGLQEPEDMDGDGDGQPPCAGDCDDTEPLIALGAPEICDGLDNDCDGAIDESCQSCDRWVPFDHATVQSAITAAAPLDVVCIAPGTHLGNVHFQGDDITVWGVLGPTVTVLEGNGDSVVRFDGGESPASILRGLTVRNGSAPYLGGGVHIDGASPTLIELVIEDNLSNSLGGGVGVVGGAPTLSNVLIRDNAAAYGGGLIADSYASVLVRDSRIADNHATDGGGGCIVYDYGELELENVTIDGNHSDAYGGGVFVDVFGFVTANHVGIVENRAVTWGGGVYTIGNDWNFLDLTNVLIAGNEAEVGGGLYLSSHVLSHIHYTAVIGNFAQEGAGIRIYGTQQNELRSVSITGNVAALDGGGMKGTPTTYPSYVNVWGNTPDQYSGMTDHTGQWGNLSVDPGYLAITDPDPLQWDLHLGVASPLSDAGDFSMPADPDGSTPDMGVYGGEQADGWDRDQDGVPEWWMPGPYDFATYPGLGWDCNDRDASVYPGNGC